MKRLEVWRKGRLGALEGPSKWQYDEELDTFYYGQAEVNEDDTLDPNDLEYKDWVAPLALSARMRLRADEAEERAAAMLEQGDLDMLGITRILMLINFPMSSRRKNVLPKGVAKVQGQLLGMYAHRDRIGVTTATDECSNTVQLLCRWMRSVDRNFEFTSIQVNRNYASRPHVDKNNEGMSYIIGLGRFTGGEVWVHDDSVLADGEWAPGRSLRLSGGDVGDHYKDGQNYYGRVLDVYEKWVVFDGNRLHFTRPFQGERISLIFFKNSQAGEASVEVRARLRELGFRFPWRPLGNQEEIRLWKKGAEEHISSLDDRLIGPVAGAMLECNDMNRVFEVRGLSDRPCGAALMLCLSRTAVPYEEELSQICQEHSWDTCVQGRGRLLRASDRAPPFRHSAERALYRTIKSAMDRLGMTDDDVCDEVHVHLDVGTDADTDADTCLVDLYNPCGARDFTRPLRACVHIIVGQVTQLVVGQRKGAKFCHDEKTTEAFVIRSGDLVVTNMGFNKTRCVSLGRSTVGHDPVVHVTLIWTRMMPESLERLSRGTLDCGEHSCLLPLRYGTPCVPPLTTVEPDGDTAGPRFRMSSVTVINLAAFLRWASNDGGAWDRLVARLGAGQKRSSRGLPSVAKLRSLAHTEWGDSFPAPVSVNLQRIERLASHLARMKSRRCDGGKVTLAEVNRQDGIAWVARKLRLLKERFLLDLAHRLPVSDASDVGQRARLEHTLRVLMFARPWCAGDGLCVSRKEHARIYRTVCNLVHENKRWWEALRRHPYVDDDIVVDVPCPKDLLPIGFWEVEAYAYQGFLPGRTHGANPVSPEESIVDVEEAHVDLHDVCIRYLDQDAVWGSTSYVGPERPSLDPAWVCAAHSVPMEPPAVGPLSEEVYEEGVAPPDGGVGGWVPDGPCICDECCPRSSAPADEYCAFVSPAVCVEYDDGADSRGDGSLCQMCTAQPVERSLRADQSLRLTECVQGKEFLWADVLKRPVVLAMGVTANPPRREHFEIMQRARAFCTWRGEEVLRGYFVPEGGTVSECRVIRRALEAAIEEEEGDGAWLECCRPRTQGDPRGIRVEGDLTPVAERWPNASVVRVQERVGFSLNVKGPARVYLPPCIGARASQVVEENLGEIVGSTKEQIERWWSSRGAAPEVPSLGVARYRLLHGYCHHGALVAWFNGICGTELEDEWSWGIGHRSDVSLVSRICAVVSQSFGSSLRSFYTDDDVTAEDARARANPAVHRVVLEVCCGERSRISEKRNCRDEHCLCVRVTLSDDMTRDDTLRAVINVLKAYDVRVLVWFAIPCTGGCPFARINAGRSPKAKLRLGEHWTLFELLWDKAAKVMLAARELGAVIAFEWPTSCEHWWREEVWRHMTDMQYHYLEIHGCMYGLRSIARATRGLPIRKPWSIATDCVSLGTYLNKTCRGYWHVDEVTGKKVAHASCSGVNTEVSEGYTDEMAVAVHRGHKDHVYGLAKL